MLVRIALAAVILAAAGAARAADIPTCPLAPGVAEVPFDLAPKPLQAAFAKDRGPFALPGQPFNPSDVVSPGSPPSQRLIWVRKKGTRWIVAYEKGGRGYSNEVAVYDLTYDGLVHPGPVRNAAVATVCQVSNSALGAAG